MKCHVIGAIRMSGIGKESGKPYDFAQVLFLNPVSVTAGERFSLHGFGFEVGKLDLATDALNQFSEVKFPALLELTIDNVAGRNGLKAVVTGIARGVAARAAA